MGCHQRKRIVNFVRHLRKSLFFNGKVTLLWPAKKISNPKTTDEPERRPAGENC